MAGCLHCGQDTPADKVIGDGFCCTGCEAAYNLINGLGLGRYYERRSVDPDTAPLKPDEDAAVIDYSAHVHQTKDGLSALYLMVEGIHCAACVWLIETVLGRTPGVVKARVNMTTRRLTLEWDPQLAEANSLAASIAQLGYRLVPFDPRMLGVETQKEEKELLRAMAVAGFAAGNVMLLSVSIWAGYTQGMLSVTRDMMHWLSALIVLPAVAYAGVPFFRSALSALRNRRVNMDVPISLAVILASAMSLFETINHGQHAYFDSAVTLLFFLLIGRYLDRRARGRARSAAEHMLALNAGSATVIDEAGEKHMVPPNQVPMGATVFVATGERITVDGRVSEGTSETDTSLITGETIPQPVSVGSAVFAGTVNLSAPLKIQVTAADEGTLLAEIVRMMEAAEQGRAKYVALADRVARYYAPVVHGLALITFIGWVVFSDLGWQPSLLNAIAVLIITCPCALALAVPVVQVIASGRLMRQGILIKTGTALERLAESDWVVFDKTGTLTEGRPELINADEIGPDILAKAAGLAAASKHPLAKALVRAAPKAAPVAGVREYPGQGLGLRTEAGEIRLGRRDWCGGPAVETDGPEMWFAEPGKAPVQIRFEDRLRVDAPEVVAALKAQGYGVELLSGDREAVVVKAAEGLGIERFQAQCTPADKRQRLETLANEGRKVVMVGDGLNDAPALAAAHASLSPSSAIDVSQTAADVVFQGQKLSPVLEALAVSKRADRLVKQNFALAFLYNSITIPLAVAGMITPLVAAVAMSSSSIVVIGNSLRLTRRRIKSE